jgi:alcohol dehydrogenase
VILDLIPESTRARGLSTVMKGAGMVTRFLPIPQPTLLVGPGSSGRLGQAITGFGHAKILIVTDAIIAKLGLLKDLTEALDAGGVKYVVFDEITPDAPIPLVERGIAFFRTNRCDAIVAFGGGSAMDASKVIAVSIANPGKSLRSLAGYFKGLRSPVHDLRGPDDCRHRFGGDRGRVWSRPRAAEQAGDRRYAHRAAHGGARSGPDDRPAAAHHRRHRHGCAHARGGVVHRPVGDALHGRLALTAVGLIFENLRIAYSDGKNLEAREKMALASTYAGMAFTRANVGYVHAIAHQFGGKYHTPHGLANAIMLPHVLKFSAPAVNAAAREAGGARPARGGARVGGGAGAALPRRGRGAEPRTRDSRAPRGPARGRHPGAGESGLPRGAHRLPGAALHDAGAVQAMIRRVLPRPDGAPAAKKKPRVSKKRS